MKSLLTKLPLFLLFVLVISCGNSDDDVSFDLNTNELGEGEEADDCLGFDENQLLLSIQSQETELPAKVSILFKVSDNLGNPISGLTADQFTIYEQGRNDACFNSISASESQARISPNTQVFSNKTLLVLDLSNSVLENSLDELKAAATSFVQNVMPETETTSFEMAIYWFDGQEDLQLLNPLTSSAAALTASIAGITEDISSDSSTNLYGAVIQSTAIAEELVSANEGVIGAASIVIFTDGTDQASSSTEAEALEAVTNAGPNISFFTIGLGDEIDQGVLEAIGKTDSEVATNTEELEATFNQISNQVSEAANSYYLFEYCSPKRDGSGTNNLVIQLTDNAGQGAVQTSFSADGFTGGCE